MRSAKSAIQVKWKEESTWRVEKKIYMSIARYKSKRYIKATLPIRHCRGVSDSEVSSSERERESVESGFKVDVVLYVISIREGWKL